ncbi:MAG: GyrI-like domain-containing protein [Thermoleophilia bacterium]|nr:GyrI-like domain-containing protein [Thermoleophilia bacterium]
MTDVELQYLQPIWVAAFRHRGPHDPVLTDETWGELIVWASPRRLLGRSMDARGIGLCWDDPRQHDARDRRYDVGVPIDPEDAAAVDAPGFVLVTAPGRYLRVTHRGAYERILSTYDEVFDGPMRYDGYTLLAQPIIEIYRDTPSEVDEDELRTDIYFPVVKG